jgi:(2R)-ethylmalonyl-CoA mutase
MCRHRRQASTRSEDEAVQLKARGVARVYTPKDFDLTQIMREIVDVVDATA